MLGFSIIIFFFLFGQSICENAIFDVSKLCNDRHSLFVSSGDSITLRLTLQSGLNCSLKVTSKTPKLNFRFNSPNLPFDNDSAMCLDSVTVLETANDKSANIHTLLQCGEADLPKYGNLLTRSPAIISFNSSCSKCNHFSSPLQFEVTVSPKFDRALRIVTPTDVLHSFVYGVVLLAILFIVGCGVVHRNKIFKILNIRSRTVELSSNNYEGDGGSDGIELRSYVRLVGVAEADCQDEAANNDRAVDNDGAESYNSNNPSTSSCTLDRKREEKQKEFHGRFSSPKETYSTL